MIASVSTVASGRSLANYLERGRGRNAVEDPADRVAWSEGRNLASTWNVRAASAVDVADEMRDEARANKNVAEPFGHIIISWKRLTDDERAAGSLAFSQANGEGPLASDAPSKAEMLDVADRAIEKLDLADHQVWIVAHKDTDTPHMHLMVNRVHPVTGKVNGLWYSQQKLAQVFREVEQERGWATPKRGIELAEKGYISSRRRSALKIRAHQWEDFGGNGPFSARADVGSSTRPTADQFTLQDAIDTVLGTDLRQVRSWDELERVLASRALWLTPRKSGFVISSGYNHVALSSLSTPVSRRLYERVFGQSWNAYAGSEVFDESYAQDGAAAVDYIDEREGEILAVKWRDFTEEVLFLKSDVPPHLAPALEAEGIEVSWGPQASSYSTSHSPRFSTSISSDFHSPREASSSPSNRPGSQPGNTMESTNGDRPPEPSEEVSPGGVSETDSNESYQHFSEVPRDIRIELRARIDAALRGDVTATEFFDRLESDGQLKVRASLDEESGLIGNVTYAFRGEEVEGHLLGKHYTWEGVQNMPGFSLASDDRARVYQALGIPQAQAEHFAAQQAAEQVQGAREEDEQSTETHQSMEADRGAEADRAEVADRGEVADAEAPPAERQPHFPDLPIEIYSRLALASDDLYEAIEENDRASFLEAASRHGLHAELTGGDDVHFTLVAHDMDEFFEEHFDVSREVRRLLADQSPLPRATVSGSELARAYHEGFGKGSMRHPPTSPEERALEFAAGYYRSVYDGLHRNHPVKQYMRADREEGGRGFDEAAERAFEIGFAPDDWRPFFQAAVQEGFSPEVLQKAGLIQLKHSLEKKGYAVDQARYALRDAPEGSEEEAQAKADLEQAERKLKEALAKHSGQEYIDIFRGRIIFPVRSQEGRAVGMGARLVPNLSLKVAPGQGKYRNSPESELFSKRRELFGRTTAQNALNRQGRHAGEEKEVFVVEGYFDAMKMHQKGFENTVAGMGTALSTDHAEAIAEMGASRAVVIFDGGEQEEANALQAMMHLERAGVSADALLLDEGKDPDDLLSQNGESGEPGVQRLRELLQAQRVSTAGMMFRAEGRKAAVTKADQATRAMRRVARLIADAPPEKHERLVRTLIDERERLLPGTYESEAGRVANRRKTRRQIFSRLEGVCGMEPEEIGFLPDEVPQENRPERHVEAEAADARAGEQTEPSAADAFEAYEELFGKPMLSRSAFTDVDLPPGEALGAEASADASADASAEGDPSESDKDLEGLPEPVAIEVARKRKQLADQEEEISSLDGEIREVLRMRRRLRTVNAAIEEVAPLTAKEEMQTLQRETAQSRSRLRKALGRVYHRPARALDRLEHLARRHGPKAALDGLYQEPQRLGSLRVETRQVWRPLLRYNEAERDQSTGAEHARAEPSSKTTSGQLREQAATHLALEAAERAAERARLSEEAEKVAAQLRDNSKAAMFEAMREAYREPRKAFESMQRSVSTDYIDESAIAVSLEHTPEAFGSLRGANGSGERLRAEVAAEQVGYHLRQFTAHVARVDEHRNAIQYAREAYETQRSLVGDAKLPASMAKAAAHSKHEEQAHQKKAHQEQSREAQATAEGEPEAFSVERRAVLSRLRSEKESLEGALAEKPTVDRLESYRDDVAFRRDLLNDDIAALIQGKSISRDQAAEEQQEASLNADRSGSAKRQATVPETSTNGEAGESHEAEEDQERSPSPGFGGRARERDRGPAL